jgi:4-hydroxybenzoate polyprenyltransferase
MEDVKGDKKNGCQTIPIIKGIPTARKIVSGLVVFTILLLFYCGYLCFTHNLKLLSSFLLITINIPLFILLFRFYKSGTKADYHAASTLMKWIMVAGILGILIINMDS